MLAGILIAAALGAGSPARAQDCARVKERLDRFFEGLPRLCRSDNDCAAYYYGASACDRPIVVRKPGVAASAEPKLTTLQADVRKACAAEFAKQPACSAIPAHPVCRQNRCMDPLNPPPPYPAQWTHAVLKNSCAPWDGPAIAVFLTNASGCDVSFPNMSIYIWKLPIRAGSTYVLKDNLGGASRCRSASDCERAVSATITFDTFEQGKGASGSYDLEFAGGEHHKGRFDAKSCEEPMFCG